MCWPGARLETLCSWKEGEQKPAKEGGKGCEGEERKRKTGRREGERRWESEQFGAAQLGPEVSRQEANRTLAFGCPPLKGCFWCAVDLQPRQAQAQDRWHGALPPCLSSSASLSHEVGFKWTSGKPSEGKTSYKVERLPLEGEGMARRAGPWCQGVRGGGGGGGGEGGEVAGYFE